MKSSEVCSLAINIVAWNYGVVQYRMNNTTYFPDMSWNLLTWYNGAWHADCLGLVRAVLCGWHADKTVTAGGADMSYGCYSENNAGFNEARFLESCTVAKGGGGVFQDFSLLPDHPCSLLYKDGHVGIYVGEFQLDGKTYNTCECTTSYEWGGLPTYTDIDGNRRRSKEADRTLSYWTDWGIFNTGGVDYGLTEYDGGGTGATGFGTALTQTEVDFYWDTLTNLTYDYVEAIANSIHGMDASVFAIMAGWGWGEAYSRVPPDGETEIDKYMAYLCDCVPVNYFEGLGLDTAQSMADMIRGGDPRDTYTVPKMNERAQMLRDAESTQAGQDELRALLLALLNPDQNAYFCNGYPRTDLGDIIIYQNDYPVEGTIYVFYNPSYQVPYDITGSGIRGGRPDPAGQTHKGLPRWMYLRPYQHYYSRRARIR